METWKVKLCFCTDNTAKNLSFWITGSIKKTVHFEKMNSFYHKGKGNISMTGEFNTFSDPESALVVFNELPENLYLIPLELCWSNALSWVSRIFIKGT